MQNNCHKETCVAIIPCGEDISIERSDCEVQADLCLSRRETVVIWGNVTDCQNNPVDGALVKLLKYADGCSGELQGICHTYTDCKGFYQFDVPRCTEGKYRVIASKAAMGRERAVRPCATPLPEILEACNCQEREVEKICVEVQPICNNNRQSGNQCNCRRPNASNCHRNRCGC